MSEKRFSLEYLDNMPYVKDNFNGDEYYLYWVVEWMNELIEENEKLNSEMKINLKEFSRLFKQNFAQKRKINDLQAENIQLRQELKKARKSDLND